MSNENKAPSALDTLSSRIHLVEDFAFAFSETLNVKDDNAELDAHYAFKDAVWDAIEEYENKLKQIRKNG